jgi:hypothetical protein
MNSKIFKNVYGQFHTWWQSTGVGLAILVALYITENADWTVRGIATLVAGSLVAAGFTKHDHKQTEVAVEKEKAETDSITEGELK